MAITLEAIRAAGGIVHSDGNIFFRDISMLQGLAGAAPAAVLDVHAIAAAVCQRVAELPDRDSPEDWPEAMLVTGPELIDAVADEIEQALAQAAPAAPTLVGDEQADSYLAEPGRLATLARSHPAGLVRALARAALAAAPQAPAAQVIENLLQLARIVNTAVEDWGETKEDDSLEVIFHKEEADKLEEILEFFDSLPDAPPEEGVILSGPSRAARVLRATAAPAAPAEGEVLVEVIGLTGSGKSAICGEIEILCRALGLDVSWPDGDPEKNMTHAEWTAAIEAYKPRVRIVERNVPRQSNGGPAK